MAPSAQSAESGLEGESKMEDGPFVLGQQATKQPDVSNMADDRPCVTRPSVPSRSFPLAELPDDLLASILFHLSSAQISVVSTRVCHAWTIGPNRRVWLSLAQAQNIHMPRLDSGSSLRSATNLRRAYFQSVARRAAHRRAEAEAAIIKLWGRIKKGELRAAALEKVFGKGGIDANHRMGLHRGWTAVFTCAWAGRTKTMERLVRAHGADLSIRDNNDCSPLGVAAWAGHTATVAWILKSGRDYGSLEETCQPPMTSSCGGKGPYTPEEWAQRKGHTDIVKLLAASRIEAPSAQGGEAALQALR